MSGVRIVGSGSEMSSTAMVTFMPGVSSACSGSMSSGWLQRVANRGARIRQTGVIGRLG